MSISGSSSGAVLYRYQDASGIEHLADSLSEVPAALRSHAVAVQGDVTVSSPSVGERVHDEAELRSLQATAAAKVGARRAEQALESVGWRMKLHLPSLGIGAGLTLALVLGLSALRRRPGRFLRLAFGLALAVAMGVGYLSWIRLATGVGSGGMATPASMINEARRAADAARTHAASQETLLEEIDAAGR
jgi:hypothetical protein